MLKAHFGTLIHSVVAHDTLYHIAIEYNTTVSNILAFNTISNPYDIQIGQKIIVPLSPPEAELYTVRTGDTLYLIAKKYQMALDNLVKYNYSLQPPYLVYPGQHLVITPSLK
jgi:LysM repeat protein